MEFEFIGLNENLLLLGVTNRDIKLSEIVE